MTSQLPPSKLSRTSKRIQALLSPSSALFSLTSRPPSPAGGRRRCSAGRRRALTAAAPRTTPAGARSGRRRRPRTAARGLPSPSASSSPVFQQVTVKVKSGVRVAARGLLEPGLWLGSGQGRRRVKKRRHARAYAGRIVSQVAADGKMRAGPSRRSSEFFSCIKRGSQHAYCAARQAASSRLPQLKVEPQPHLSIILKNTSSHARDPVAGACWRADCAGRRHDSSHGWTQRQTEGCPR